MIKSGQIKYNIRTNQYKSIPGEEKTPDFFSLCGLKKCIKIEEGLIYFLNKSEVV